MTQRNPLDPPDEQLEISGVAKMRQAIAALLGDRSTWSIWGWVTGSTFGSPPVFFLQRVELRDDSSGDIIIAFGEIYTQRLEPKRYGSVEAIANDLQKAVDDIPVRLTFRW